MLVREWNMKIFAIILALVLAGCAVDPAVQRWSEENIAKAQAGTLPWSTYYKQLYSQVEGSNGTLKGPMLTRINLMIEAAHSYEIGQITKDGFESMQRLEKAQQITEEEQARARAAVAFGASLQNSYRPPVTCTSSGYGNTVQTICR